MILFARSESMRIDKYLKNSRIIKRRTIAKEACERGRVLINGRQAKAGDEVNVGDKVSISFGSEDMDIEIVDLKDNVRKEDAEKLYKRI